MAAFLFEANCPAVVFGYVQDLRIQWSKKSKKDGKKLQTWSRYEGMSRFGLLECLTGHGKTHHFEQVGIRKKRPLGHAAGHWTDPAALVGEEDFMWPVSTFCIGHGFPRCIRPGFILSFL